MNIESRSESEDPGRGACLCPRRSTVHGGPFDDRWGKSSQHCKAGGIAVVAPSAQRRRACFWLLRASISGGRLRLSAVLCPPRFPSSFWENLHENSADCRDRIRSSDVNECGPCR